MLTINLYEKTMIKNGISLIEKGIPKNGYNIPNDNITFTQLEQLYQKYKHSIPDKKKYKYNYFKTMSCDELKISDITVGVKRQKAKEDLELSILTGILNKSLKWPDSKKWFWQSEKDKDFILLRTWFL